MPDTPQPEPTPAPENPEVSPNPGLQPAGVSGPTIQPANVSGAPIQPVVVESPPTPSGAQPVEVVVNLHTERHESGERKVSKDELEAQVKLLEAKRPFWDRLITSGLLPIALLIVGPAATWYFAHQADRSLTAVKRSNEEVVELRGVVKELSETLSSADKRRKEMDTERAAELRALYALSERLDSTLQTALIQMAVYRALRDPRVGLSSPGVLPRVLTTPSRAEVVREVAAQVRLPGLDRASLEVIAGETYDRLNKSDLAVQPAQPALAPR